MSKGGKVRSSLSQKEVTFDGNIKPKRFQSKRSVVPKEQVDNLSNDRDKESINKSRKSSKKTIIKEVTSKYFTSNPKVLSRTEPALYNVYSHRSPSLSADTSKKNPSSQPTQLIVSSSVTKIGKPSVVSILSTQSSKRSLIIPRSPKPSVLDRIRSNRQTIEKATRNQKVFAVSGVFPAIRRALLSRGWIEKKGALLFERNVEAWGTSLSSIGKSSSSAISAPSIDLGPFSAPTIPPDSTGVLKGCSADFIWAYRRSSLGFTTMKEGQLLNHHPNSVFTSKVGITECLHNYHWYSEDGVSSTYFPRCYRLCNEEERAAFVGDFRLCACMGLLKWLVVAYDRSGDNGILEPAGGTGVIPSCVEFAVKQLKNYVRLRRNDDLDSAEPPGVTGAQWDTFLNQYYNVLLRKVKLARTSEPNFNGQTLYLNSKRALQRLAPFWPQLNIDGTNNIWIVKPGAKSRGIGIVLINQLTEILRLSTASTSIQSNWVVQKYIERPMLIFNTKFDIRQWFIVSDWNPLTVWFYKESYVRFCSKPFTLDDLHESIHLCNNIVQNRYKNSVFRDGALPDENMWDNYTFQAYLKTIGKMSLWHTDIYPGMKQGILGVLLAAQETVTAKKGCFELYGADFMICEDFHPWLIEINCSPCMASTTQVTQRMCPQCLEDVIKVVVDRRQNDRADTGLFELIYRQPTAQAPCSTVHASLEIRGRQLFSSMDGPSVLSLTRKKSKSKHEAQDLNGNPTFLQCRQSLSSSSKSVSLTQSQTIMNLIKSLRLDGQLKSFAELPCYTLPPPCKRKSKKGQGQDQGQDPSKRGYRAQFPLSAGKSNLSDVLSQNSSRNPMLDITNLAATHQELEALSKNLKSISNLNGNESSDEGQGLKNVDSLVEVKAASDLEPGQGQGQGQLPAQVESSSIPKDNKEAASPVTPPNSKKLRKL